MIFRSFQRIKLDCFCGLMKGHGPQEAHVNKGSDLESFWTLLIKMGINMIFQYKYSFYKIVAI